MNRRGFFGRSLVALGALFTVKPKADLGNGTGMWRDSSPNTTKLTPRGPDWQPEDKGIFLGDSQDENSGIISYSYADKNSGRIVHVMRDGRKCIV